MAGTAPDQRFPAENGFDRKPFLTTHRALGVCTRELARLTDEVVAGAKALRNEGVEATPVVRQAPGRCIVQLGPVAITISWLRSSLDAVVDGELLIVIWRGAVAPSGEHCPERKQFGRQPAVPVVSLWEETFTVEAVSEESWRWHPAKNASEPLSSTELATRCIERLRAAHADSPAEPPASATQSSATRRGPRLS